MKYKDKIEILLESYEQEIRIACQSFYAMKHINNIAYHNRDIHTCLNKNALTWGIITHSLQVTFFMSFGRLFDENDDTQSVHSLLNYCSRNRREFSKWRLYRRKIRDGIDEKDALDYVRHVHYLHPEFFKKFIKLKREYSKIFKSAYKSIRHQVFGHRIQLTHSDSSRLFQSTSIAEVEDTLEFLYKLSKVIRFVVDNGRLTDLCNHGFSEEKFIKTDVEKLLNSLLTT